MIYFFTNNKVDNITNSLDDLVVNDLEGEHIITIANNGLWTKEKIENLNYSDVWPDGMNDKGANAYLGDKWVGTTED
ncbi:hypothetical protein MTBPR1_80184 [Candidatus Terasakiella magnetica]|uniref:Uncharacterized protein n=1 Tax=Candidatus Terasakiella magnetica TaxID=1867952 RepID=A0A1C3RLD9_9PROT|nr:hypothetical protein [Candidatus Terasakiella magnetica]SCA58130.1 hypothetical protein MTBPR1_80184 [Candidatus Terasakiella magnetica]